MAARRPESLCFLPFLCTVHYTSCFGTCCAWNLLCQYNLPVAQVSVAQLAACRERDMFRWLKLPLRIYKAKVPVKTDASSSSAVDGRGSAEISVVLPSDHLQALHDQGSNVSCHKCWLAIVVNIDI